MSGHWSRLKNDKCQNELQLMESRGPGNYALFVEAHEINLNSKINSVQKEIKTNCNNNFSVSNIWSKENTGLKIDIENDLLDLDQASKCNANKHQMCGLEDKSQRCHPGFAANPYACERDLVPTNMVMPEGCGYN